MKHRMLSVLIIAAVLYAANIELGWARSQFKFPEKIQFKFLKNGLMMGECTFKYTKEISKESIRRPLSALVLEDFGGMGFTSKVKLHTYIFRDDLSVYLDSVLKGKDILSQTRLREGMGFDGKEGQIFIYKESDTKGNIQTEIFTKYKGITFLSSFFVTSRRVASGTHKKDERYNLLIDKSTKIVEMKYGGQEKVPFQGKYFPAEVILLTNPNNNDMVVIRMKIFKDSDGYCYPVSIIYSGYQKESFEMRADKVKK
jgi:hypothetical protein